MTSVGPLYESNESPSIPKEVPLVDDRIDPDLTRVSRTSAPSALPKPATEKTWNSKEKSYSVVYRRFDHGSRIRMLKNIFLAIIAQSFRKHL
jgi:hypothetical protein